MRKSLPDLSAYAQTGIRLNLRVTPKAAQNRIVVEDDLLRVYVTQAPDSGKANRAVLKLLAQAIGIAPSCLTLIRGETDRNKVVGVNMG